MMTRSNAIQIIHIAKGQLALDDDTYRSLLGAVVQVSRAAAR